MQKEIEIFAGDVYRAKTETRFRSGIFFEEVYRRTDAIVCDILEQMRIYSEDSRRQGGHKAKYHGMGNNIVVFCADRGQGKTSAMQSYTAYLQDHDIAEKGFFEKNSIISRSCFKVLDPIDPSSLDSGESIIRVLVSRLFLEFSKIVEDDRMSFKDEIDFRKEKDNILKAFQRCYENIDYLQKAKNVEAYDLETLAQLGSSAELKKNLYRLVEYFLDMYFGDGREKKPAYLVVQIDDADLSMGDIFKICDDIRNYFSVPNIIVMMATNYAQLELAICQRYMKQYEHVIRLQPQRKLEEECSRMAFRYLEKMLPAGHRVVLPTVDVLINENVDSLRLLYYRNSNDETAGSRQPVEMFVSETESGDTECKCRNMQQQLIKLLYMKTGIILLERQGEMHPVLPHTLRELTHFTKLLDDMESIDQQEALRVRAGAGTRAEVEKWSRNLDILKRYFLNYWCGTHLRYGQQALLEEIDQVNRKMDMVCHSINKYITSCGRKALQVNSFTYGKIMKEAVEDGLADEPVLRDAIIFYYSIVLNEWFVQTIEEPEKAKMLACFIEKPLDVKITPGTREYNVLQFDLEAEKIREYAEGELMNVSNRVWLEAFCTDGDNASVIDEERVIKLIEGKTPQNKKKARLQFNLFHPILTMLFSSIWLNRENEKQPDSDSASISDQIGRREAPDHFIDMSYLVSAKNIIVNYDLRRWVQTKIQEKIDEQGRNEDRRIDKVWKSFYTAIDSWVDMSRYLEADSILAQVCFEDNFENPVLGSVVFLSNEANRKKYIMEYKDYLSSLFVSTVKRAGKIIGINSYETMELMVKQMIREIQSSSFKSNIALPTEEQKANSQFLQRIPDLRDLAVIDQRMEQECTKLSERMENNEDVQTLKEEIKRFKSRISRDRASI